MADAENNFEDALEGVEEPNVASEVDLSPTKGEGPDRRSLKATPSKSPTKASNGTSASIRSSPRKVRNVNSIAHNTEAKINGTSFTSSRPPLEHIVDEDDDVLLLKAMKLASSKVKRATKISKVVDDLDYTPAKQIVQSRETTPTPSTRKRQLGAPPSSQVNMSLIGQATNPVTTIEENQPPSRPTYTPLLGSHARKTPTSSPSKPRISRSTAKSKSKPSTKVIDESLSEKDRMKMLFKDPTTSRGRKPKEDLELIAGVRPFGSPKYPDRPRQPPSPSFEKLEARVVELDEEDTKLINHQEQGNRPITRLSMGKIPKATVKIEEELPTFRMSSDDQFDSDSDSVHSDNGSDGNFRPYGPLSPTKGAPGVRRGPGRPRKIRNDDESAISFPRRGRKVSGSPRKNNDKTKGTTPSPVKRGRGRPPKIKTEDKVEFVEKFEIPPKRAFKSTERKFAGLITNVPEDDPEELGTNFMYLNNHDLSKGRKRGKKSAAEMANKERLLHSDAFSSPRKQRSGLLDLSATPSPYKRGIFSNIDMSPNRILTGRGGSPRKITKKEEEDRSARKRANRTLYSKLLEDGVEDSDDEDYRDNVRVAEKIILESHEERYSAQTTPLATPRKAKPFDLPFHDPNFVASPLPTFEDEEHFTEGRHDDKALFLDGPDGYFDQQRHKVKPSNNSMVQAPTVDYDEFNSLLMFSGFLHNTQRASLIAKYEQLYTQWRFELEENFNLLFFGIGSKRKFLLSFVEDYLLDFINVPVVVVNGYNPALKLNDILQQVLSTLKLTKKVPKRQTEVIDFIVEHLNRRRDQDTKLILLVHNLDGESLRDEKIQGYMSRLSSSPQIKLIASVDHINAPLLWNSVMHSKFNFLWHNITTYNDYITETSFKDPLALGRTQKSSGAKGAKYVLASLTLSSRDLYRVLAENQLAHMEEDLETKKDAQSHSLKGSVRHALEFTRFFLLCAEEFISSNEINFRTMLMEFVEHKMAVLTKDQAGTELVYIPYTMEEIQTLLTDVLDID